MPQLVDFPGCCTAKILTGFGETPYGEYAFRPDGNKLKEGQLTEYLEKQIPWLKRSGQYALVFATTNSHQKTAIKELEAFGFQRTPEVSKMAHYDANLIGWYYVVGKLVEAVVEPVKAIAEDLPVRDALGRFARR